MWRPLGLEDKVARLPSLGMPPAEDAMQTNLWQSSQQGSSPDLLSCAALAQAIIEAMHRLGARQRWMLRLVADLSDRHGRAARGEVCTRFGSGAEAMISSLQAQGHLEDDIPADFISLAERGRRVIGI